MTEIKATEIKAGMVIEIRGERFAVTRVKIDGHGAVMVCDDIRWTGLSANETVAHLGHFNP